jgi:hypothetical protein
MTRPPILRRALLSGGVVLLIGGGFLAGCAGLLHLVARAFDGTESAAWFCKDLHVRTEQELAQFQEVGRQRERICTDVLYGRLPLTEGLARFEAIHDSFPLVEQTLRAAYPGLTRTEAIRRQYSDHLKSTLTQHPNEGATVRVQVEAFLPWNTQMVVRRGK